MVDGLFQLTFRLKKLNLFAAIPRTWQATTMKVDWSKAPKRARWWAVDEDGKAHWFCAPNVAAFTKFWFSEPKPAPTFGFTGDWRKSIVERPAVS